MIDSPIDEIKNRLDIVDVIQGYIRLQKAGRNYRANCPFHAEKTPSFMVSPEKQMWHCFGCGKGGSIFDFVMEMEGLEFGDALRTLAQKAGVELKKTDTKFAEKFRTEKTLLYEICDLANRFFVKQLEESKTGKEMRDYLVERGLHLDTIKEWQIG
ncbi:DNA primase, partial [Patescibacteria group bacterium]|nr:DNA primase [Patescibacteria group bacterium]